MDEISRIERYVLEVKVDEGVMTTPGTSSHNLFHGGLSVECEQCSHGPYLVCLNLVGVKERCRRICVALQNCFPDPPGDCGWNNVSFMPWFERHKEEALVLPLRHGPF